MYKRKNSIGMTLVELMFSLMFGLVMINSMIKLYLIMENNRRLQHGIITIQENAEIITQILTSTIRSSSWLGCAKLGNNFPFKNHLPFLFNPDRVISEYKNEAVKSGTDAIQIWHGSLHSDFVLQKMRGKSTLYVSSRFPIKRGNNLLISDCKTAEAFEVKQISRLKEGVQKIISSEPLEKLYDKNSEIIKLESDVFFIGKTERMDEKNHPVYALYMRNILGEKTEVAEGVTHMKIFFSMSKNKMNGVAFHIELNDFYAELYKNWNVYVALPK